MIFTATQLDGAFVMDLERKSDERGFFARTFCVDEFRAHGLNPAVAQCSISFNRHRGILRGLHWQASPHAEVKVVRCTAGAVHDVIVDLRPGSATFRRYAAFELTAANRRALYIPEGFAHGFMTLAEDSEVLYQMSVPFAPDAARGARWNDPAFGIVWPEIEPVLNPRDRSWPDFVS
jgi:dTDP-4-dehydrorhamnose 3,5-epimerase